MLVLIAPDSSDLDEEPAAYILLLGALRQLRIRADVKVFEEPGPTGAVAVPVISWRRSEAPE